MRILCVCLGNVCRSPMMERLLEIRLAGDHVVSSAGFVARPGSPMDPLAAAELARLGGSADGFSAMAWSPRLARESDLILTATSAIRSRVLEDEPGALRRTFTLLELAALVATAPPGTGAGDLVAWAAVNRSLLAGQDLDVVDPIGESPAVHRQAADQIDVATATIAAALDSGSPLGAGLAR